MLLLSFRITALYFILINYRYGMLFLYILCSLCYAPPHCIVKVLKSGANCPLKEGAVLFMCSQFCYFLSVHAILPSHESSYFKGTLKHFINSGSFRQLSFSKWENIVWTLNWNWFVPCFCLSCFLNGSGVMYTLPVMLYNMSCWHHF